MSDSSPPIHPGPYIKKSVIPQNVNISEAAKILGVSRPALSNFLNGKTSLSSRMAMRIEKAFGAKKDSLLAMQQAYDAHENGQKERQIVVRSYAPSFLDIRAMNLATWPERIDARPLLPAFLRRLVHTTGATITEADFPAYDLSQRHGWDGHVVCQSPNPWVPGGVSGWEFGCDANPKKKAEEDYKARGKLPEKERLETTFVFVTPRHWPKKAEWVAEKRSERKWKDVRAYDANDLEQWLENSPPAQAWMADILGVPREGCQTLAEYWRCWSRVADPAISPAIFRSAIEASADRIEQWLQNPHSKPLIVSAASKEEGVAFLAAATRLSEKLEVFGQQAVFFDSAQTMKKLSGITTEMIPVIFSGELERNALDAFPERKIVVVSDRNLGVVRESIEVSPPSHESFQEAIKDMNLDEGKYASVIRGSSRSPTILRRLLASTPGLMKPSWAQDQEHARWMIPFVLLGRWRWDSVSDREIISLVADVPVAVVEQRLAKLSALEDAPILQEGDVGGVASRLESLNAVAPYISEEDLERFIFVAECVLEEDDPSLDLEKSERWTAAIYGKVREYSGTVRRSIADSLILLAVHGPNALGNERGSKAEWLVASLVSRLLKDRNSRVWLSQQRDLPCYAEAAPNTFLGILEDELRKPNPAIDCLFEPAESGPFSGCDRTGMLWALEVLAWNPARLSRVILILADLCRYRIDDNWVNKPAGSIRDILLSWRPHTMATLNQRIEVLENLCSRHPEVGWSFCMSQLDSMPSMTSGTYEPRWRDETSEHDRSLSHKDVFDFRRKCLDLVLAWPEFDCEKLKELVSLLGDVPKGDRDRIHAHIENWIATDPPQSEIASLREHVRLRTMTRRARHSKKRSEGIADGRKLYARLEPSDLLQRHRWLFAKQWVEYSGDELDNDNFDHDARERWISEERAKALREVQAALGHDGIFELCALGDAASMVGWTLGRHVLSRDELLAFLVAAISGGSKFDQSKVDQCVSGALHQLADAELEDFLADASQALAEKGGPNARMRLHLLAPFGKKNWDMVAKFGQDTEKQYWCKVNVGWGRFDDAELNFCVEKLLAADRPRAGFFVAHFECEKLKTEILMSLLHDMGTKDSEPAENYRWQSHDIISAFEALENRDDVDPAKLVQLEFMYVRAIGSHSGFKFANLSRELANSPQSFFHLVALCFRRNDDREDDPALGVPTDADERGKAAKMAYTTLDNVTQIPGTQDDGTLNIDHLREWVKAVRELAKKHDREDITDQQIGGLLQRCGVGEDGIWPRAEVRQVMEETASEEIAIGMSIEERNSRGAQWRPSPDNGDQERELAAKYRGYGEAIMNRTPFVARMLFNIAESYERDAQRHDVAGRRRERFPD
ncbi:HigA family addiction module antidote protein [Marivibrio halodurans]|uniref:HigA family addiction module antidote protein n=1 Tax=Marivibrio halodurans TaxID=2039722 RepID=A0A8J7RZ94_9PROT|nr:HigA family addiction module antitoxin [Marivibrio halodurans]MBP5857417.1 HigA family addiction module antidote protein [Marivibrio halodurans]